MTYIIKLEIINSMIYFESYIFIQDNKLILCMNNLEFDSMCIRLDLLYFNQNPSDHHHLYIYLHTLYKNLNLIKNMCHISLNIFVLH